MRANAYDVLDMANPCRRCGGRLMRVVKPYQDRPETLYGTCCRCGAFTPWKTTVRAVMDAWQSGEVK